MAKKPRPSYPRNTRIHPYLSSATRDQLDQWVAAHGGTESAAVEEALRRMFAGFGDKETLYRRLDHMSRQLDEIEPVQAELQQLRLESRAQGQLVLLFVQLWLAHTPPLTDEQRRAQVRTAADGYRRLVAALGKALLSDRALLDELPKDVREELRSRMLMGHVARDAVDAHPDLDPSGSE